MTERRAFVFGARCMAVLGVVLAACFQIDLSGQDAPLPGAEGGVDATDEADGGAPLARVIVLSGLRPPLYVGEGNTAATDVWIGVVDRNGHLGGWTNARPLPERVIFDGATILDGRLITWATSGWFATKTSWWFATTSASGKEAWTLTPTSVSPCGGLGPLHARAVWAFGGSCPDASAGFTSIFRAGLTANNTDLEKWQPMAPLALASARLGTPTTVFAKGYAYVVAGSFGSGPINAVDYAAFDDTGFQPFAVTAALPTPRQRHAVFAARDWIFVVGGEGDVPGAQRTVFRAKIGVAGALEPWTSLGDLLPQPLTALSGFVLDDRIFLVGGRVNDVTLSAEVISTTVAPDGSLGTFEKHEPLPWPRELPLVAVDLAERGQ